MKIVTRIEMANNHLYDVSFGKPLLIIEDDGDFIITDTEVQEGELFRTPNQKEADNNLNGYAVDDDLLICGFGIYSDRKFWQLPEELKEQIYAMARK